VTEQRGSFDGSFYLVDGVATVLGDIGPENRPSQHESGSQPSFFRGYVSFREGGMLGIVGLVSGPGIA